MFRFIHKFYIRISCVHLLMILSLIFVFPGCKEKAGLKGLGGLGGIAGSRKSPDIPIPVTIKSIEISNPSASFIENAVQQLSALAVYSDFSKKDITDLATWSSSDSSVFSVSDLFNSKGLGTAKAPGNAIVTVTFSGFSGTNTINVTAANLLSIDISPANPFVPLGLSHQFTAFGQFSDLSIRDISSSVSWQSSDVTITSVNNTGLALSLKVGATIITATLGTIIGATTFTATNSELVSISITPALPSIPLGTQLQLTATGLYTDNTTQNLTSASAWRSGSTSILNIGNSDENKGLATALATGVSNISVEMGSVSSSIDLNVTAAVLTNISVTPINHTLPAGLMMQFSATGIYSDNTNQDLTSLVTWISSEEQIAIISNIQTSSGQTTAISQGFTTISAVLGNIVGSVDFNVSPAELTSIEVTPTDTSLVAGFNQQYIATGIYTDNTNKDITELVNWQSSNSSVASVSNLNDSKGHVYTFISGLASITASYAGLSASTTLTVNPATLTSINVNPTDQSIALGNSFQFSATGIYSDSTSKDITSEVTWQSSNDTVASVSNAISSRGLATSLTVGSTVISAKSSGVTGNSNFTITPATLSSISASPVNPTVIKGMTNQFTATGIYSDSSTQNLTTSVTWSSSATTIAGISNAAGSKGLSTTLLSGTTTISATLGSISGSTVMTVVNPTLISISISPANPIILKGAKQQFTAQGLYSNSTTQDLTSSVTWASSKTNFATISNASGSKGLATSKAKGTTTISATLSGVSGTTTLKIQ